MTKRAGVSASNDPGLAALLQAEVRRHLLRRQELGLPCARGARLTNEENLEGIRASVEAAVAAGKEAMVDCEHFFDGYKANPDYALACARTAYDAGRALGGAVRHQWRHAAVGGARDRRRR